MSKQSKEMIREKAIKRYNKKKAAGLCVTSGCKSSAAQGSVLCLECKLDGNRRGKEFRAKKCARHICYDCKNITEPGYSRCKECLRINRMKGQIVQEFKLTGLEAYQEYPVKTRWHLPHLNVMSEEPGYETSSRYTVQELYFTGLDRFEPIALDNISEELRLFLAFRIAE